MATKGTQMRSNMIAETMPIIASGVQPLPLLERGAAEGAAGIDASMDVAVVIVIQEIKTNTRCVVMCLVVFCRPILI